MRAEPNIGIEQYRREHPVLGMSPPGVNWGFFVIDGWNVLSSGAAGADDGRYGPATEWEHVSVSRPNRTPEWATMQRIKELFWRDDETVLQFHPRKEKYVNFHKHVLHMWRKAGEDHELPPTELIA